MAGEFRREVPSSSRCRSLPDLTVDHCSPTLTPARAGAVRWSARAASPDGAAARRPSQFRLRGDSHAPPARLARHPAESARDSLLQGNTAPRRQGRSTSLSVPPLPAQDNGLDPPTRTPSQTSGSGRSLVSRAQRRSEQLRDFFEPVSQTTCAPSRLRRRRQQRRTPRPRCPRIALELPADRPPRAQELVETFNCALRQKILLQGHMYVFQHSLCFYCNIFGYVQKRVTPLTAVTTVRKRKSYGLPNAIEVEHDGQTDLYTSFLNRREAYRLILASWASSRRATRRWPRAAALGPASFSEGARGAQQPAASAARLRQVPPLRLSRPAAAATTAPWCSAPRSALCTSRPLVSPPAAGKHVPAEWPQPPASACRAEQRLPGHSCCMAAPTLLALGQLRGARQRRSRRAAARQPPRPAAQLGGPRRRPRGRRQQRCRLDGQVGAALQVRAPCPRRGGRLRCRLGAPALPGLLCRRARIASPALPDAGACVLLASVALLPRGVCCQGEGGRTSASCPSGRTGIAAPTTTTRPSWPTSTTPCLRAPPSWPGIQQLPPPPPRCVICATCHAAGACRPNAVTSRLLVTVRLRH